MPGVTDLGTAPAATAAARVPASPAARRLAPPRWRDGRLLAGVLLLLVSVVVGARVLASSDDTVAVVSVARGLPAGHVLVEGDLATARASLGANTAGAYVGAAELGGLTGRVLARPVTQGELLAVAAVAERAATPARVVPIKVRDGRLPGLTAGDRVDVFATALLRPTSAGAAAGPEACITVLVATDVEVAADAATEDGATDLTLLLRVAPEQAGVLVHASETAALDVTRHVVGVAPPSGSPTPAPVQGLGDFTTASCGGAR